MFKIALIPIFVVSLMCSTVTSQESSTKEMEGKILALVQPYVDAEVINCVAIGVIDGDSRLTMSVGQFSKEDTTTADENTIFEIGSISKVFTGILLADAIERGLVTANQPAGELLPEGIKMPVSKNKPERKITLTDLSTHISGLPRLPSNFDATNAKNPFENYGPEELFEFLNSHDLSRKPGIIEEYSNLGVGLLGVLISRKQETDYANLLESRIAKPLGMSDTATSVSAAQKKRLAPPNDVSCNPATSWDFDALAGAGAIRSTVSDMLKFAKANLDPPNDEIGKAIELAFTQQRKPKGLDSKPMGFGWIINSGSETRWHNGQTGGYHSMMMVNRKQNRAVVVLTNTATREVDTLASEIMQMLRGDDVKPRKFRKSMKVTSEVCDRYVGTYELNKAIAIDVAKPDDNDAGLTVQLTGQTALPIYPGTETRWFLKVVKADIEFTVNKDGKCTALTLYQNGIVQEAKKK